MKCLVSIIRMEEYIMAYIRSYALKNGASFSISVILYCMLIHNFFEHTHFNDYNELQQCCLFIYEKGLFYQEKDEPLKSPKLIKYKDIKFERLSYIKGREKLNIFADMFTNNDYKAGLFGNMLLAFQSAVDKFYDLVSQNKASKDNVHILLSASYSLK
jgi:hypothetical protein